MNPRVSPIGALASKATGFPIAKIAAKLAVGYRLDESRNDITRATPASFEPAIDYVVTKIPRGPSRSCRAPPVLGTQMQSVGEVMAIGRTFVESLQKALRSLETGGSGSTATRPNGSSTTIGDDELVAAAAVPTPERLFQIEAALRRFVSVDGCTRRRASIRGSATRSSQIVEERDRLRRRRPRRDDARRLAPAKQHGFSDGQLAYLWACKAEVAPRRLARGRVTYKTVDTCAAEFEAHPVHYGTYEDEDEIAPFTRPP